MARQPVLVVALGFVLLAVTMMGAVGLAEARTRASTARRSALMSAAASFDAQAGHPAARDFGRRLLSGMDDGMQTTTQAPASWDVLVNALPFNSTAVWTSESTLGNFICDSLLWYIKNTTSLAPTACLFNSGGIRGGLPAGAVTAADLATVLPYKNTVAAIRVTGLALLSALENGVGSLLANGSYTRSRLTFPQVSGLRFSYDASAPPNQRIRGVEVRQPNGAYSLLRACDSYIVVTNDYLAGGGDGYASLKAAQALATGSPLAVDAVAAFLAAFLPVGGYATTEGRVTKCAELANLGCAVSRSSYGSCPVNLTLLHYNDVHARITSATSSATAQWCRDADEAKGICFGGMARIANYVNSVRAAAAAANSGPVLLLDAGDMTTGTMWDVVYRDRQPSAAAQNLLGVAAFTLGNHEFDNGVDSLVRYIKQLKMPVLGCNIDATTKSPELQSLIRPYTVVELGGTGVRAGIVGWITPDTTFSSLGGANITFEDPVTAVRKCVDALKAEYGSTVDIVIGLSHAGTDSDMDVAAAVPGIDLIVGGHDHFFYYGNGVTPGPLLVASNPDSGQKPDQPYPLLVTNAVTGKNVPIVQAFYASRYLGHMQLAFNAAGDVTSYSHQPVLLGGNASANPVPLDPAMTALVANYSGPLAALSTAVVGYNPAFLSAARPVVRAREGKLGNMVCDAMRWWIANNTIFKTDACMINGGALRADLPAGNLTADQVLTLMPFGNVITVLNVTGAMLIRALESGVSGETNLSLGLGGRFPQVSGLKYSYAPAAPLGLRLMSAQLLVGAALNTTATAPIDPCRYYTLVTTDFVAGGGDDYTMLQPAERLFPLGPPLETLTIAYAGAYNPLPSGLYGRITRCDDEPGCPAMREVPDASSSCAPPPSPSPPPPSPPPGKFKCKPGVAIVGAQLRTPIKLDPTHSSARNTAECQATCDSLRGCVAFNYKATNWCFLYATATGFSKPYKSAVQACMVA